jgi:hypothetical protein
MPEFDRDGPGGAMGSSPLPVVGLTIGAVLLATWSLVIFAMLIAPAVLVAGLAARAIRRLKPQTNVRPYQTTTIIEGEYEVLDSGIGKG